ncbi:MAG TPA: phosphatidate cytidylyltransferase, partial [Gammaproteobacteria bacterium]|nr:phosphatidate cytidylyltransferase [Gammaproteobacteria bacterium]
IWWLLCLPGLLIFFAVVGDLFESLMKRSSDIKDSGDILPGHGGILDRIDSIVAVLPVLAWTLI